MKETIKYNACSLRQLEAYGKARKGDRTDQLGVRFNPGLGSGGTGKTNVGGPASSWELVAAPLLWPSSCRLCRY